jgi:hypothetical protein
MILPKHEQEKKMDTPNTELVNKQIYRIEISGHLKEKWVAWLNGMVIEITGQQGKKNTVIKVAIPDQAALRGILNKLWDLNLTLISVIQVDDSEGKENENQLHSSLER